MIESMCQWPTRRRGSVCALLLLLAGCGSPDAPEPAQQEMLRSVADRVVLPVYRDLAAAADALVMACEQLVIEPSGGRLAAAQDAWRRARSAWKTSEAFRLGPTEDLTQRFAAKIDWSPIRSQRIEEEIAGASELTAQYLDTLGVNRRGFLAVEYLLFDSDSDQAVIAALAGSANQRRRQYLIAAAADLAVQTHRLRDAWEPGRGGFRDALVYPRAATSPFATSKDAQDELIAALVRLTTVIEDKRLGEPAGLPSGQTVHPELVETRRSHNTLRDIRDNLAGIAQVYLCYSSAGRGCDLSMDALVRSVSPAISDDLRSSLSEAIRSIDAVPGPLEAAVVESPTSVAAAYQAVRQLRLGLSVGLVSALQATPRFASDGD